jgi:hypothetical protein
MGLIGPACLPGRCLSLIYYGGSGLADVGKSRGYCCVVVVYRYITVARRRRRRRNT